MRTSEHPSAIVAAFSRMAAARAEAALLISTKHRASIGDVDRLSQAVADRIAESNITGGSLIGLSAPNGPAFLAGVLALRRAGHAPILLEALAPPVDRERCALALKARAMLTCATAWPQSAAEFQLRPLEDSAPSSSSDGIAAVKVTSGSTGAPRGVALREEQLLSDEDALARTMGFGRDDRLLCTLPLSHSYGFTTLALSALVRGLTLVLPADPSPFSPLLAARHFSTTIFPTVPAYLQAWLKMAQPPQWPASIRLVISAGATLPAHTAAQFRQTCGRPVHVFYGSSECGGICYDREGGAAERGTVGTPVEGVRVSFTAMGASTGDDGLVTVESAAVGLTYLPTTDSRLHDGRFETMDLASWKNGELLLKGRVDHVINLRGRKVDPSEVENVIEALAGVDEVVVLGVASPDGGEIVRAVVASTARDLNYGRVTAWCRDRLAEHKIPRSIIFVDAIPRTSRGKIDRAALHEIGGAPGVDTGRG